MKKKVFFLFLMAVSLGLVSYLIWLFISFNNDIHKLSVLSHSLSSKSDVEYIDEKITSFEFEENEISYIQHSSVKENSAKYQLNNEITGEPLKNIEYKLQMDELIFFAPKTNANGELIGAEFGPSSELLFELGIQREDTIIYVDHFDMSDEAQSVELIHQLPSMRRLTMIVDRPDGLETFYIDLDDFEEKR
ncbi:hypothetical protein [Photobacterium minamisatsumaniensis]|uniref:hypothetical protein n=1 Tax=Photobacterium minamisatsumaniensis TaxID=2910233 RepID=UPI003D0E6ED5